MFICWFFNNNGEETIAQKTKEEEKTACIMN